MGRTGSCLDNAVAESWFASLKVELVSRTRYRTRAQARAAIFGWIAWYNRFRLHSANDYLPPIEWEQQHAIMSPLPLTGRITPVSTSGGEVHIRCFIWSATSPGRSSQCSTRWPTTPAPQPLDIYTSVEYYRKAA
jgi:hypothetical protein